MICPKCLCQYDPEWYLTVCPHNELSELDRPKDWVFRLKTLPFPVVVSADFFSRDQLAPNSDKEDGPYLVDCPKDWERFKEDEGRKRRWIAAGASIPGTRRIG